MDLRKKTTTELKAMLEKQRPEALSQSFLILALIAGSVAGEIINILHEYIKDNFKNFYPSYAKVFVVVGIFYIAAVIFLANKISVKPHSEIHNELQRRVKLKKGSNRSFKYFPILWNSAQKEWKTLAVKLRKYIKNIKSYLRK